MTDAKFIVGIDLGTTNTALAFVERGEGEDAPAKEVSIFEVEQLVEAGSVLARPVLPSFFYLAGQGELPDGSLDLPWADFRRFAVGTFARERGAEVPLRLVSSAKSWLCHARVDRRAAILPFGAPDEIPKVSPVGAATAYLTHLKDAWNHSHPESLLEDQEIFLTVPASFDAVARELSVEAARSAGLEHVTLLEEPQSAFYAWLALLGDAWRQQLEPGDRVLVCDVGGGTTDFSLIEVSDQDGNLALERVAVGDHILLGGDNMDLALAHHLHEGLRKDGKKLDAGQQRALVQAARRAKETLLADDSLGEAPITILGRGSKLIGGKISTSLSRADLERILIEGFFPQCALSDVPQTARRTGFMEMGLPFAVDAGITRHLAQFISRNAADGRLPTHLLFNGGVFNSPVLRSRLIEIISSWGNTPTLLMEADHDLAVARGAAYFGITRSGRGIRIRSATAQSYYIGIEAAAPSVPGVAPPVRALCVVPTGVEEGTQLGVPQLEVGLVVGEPVEFRLFTSTQRKQDVIGSVLDEYEWPDYLSELSPVETKLEAEGLEPGTLVPVRLEVKVTDIGTVELWSVHTAGDERWRLEFSVRDRGE